jgi:hypothetical protein
VENNVATYLKYANLRMAAESLFGIKTTDPAGVTKGSESMSLAELGTGNRHYSVIAHRCMPRGGKTVAPLLIGPRCEKSMKVKRKSQPEPYRM